MPTEAPKTKPKTKRSSPAKIPPIRIDVRLAAYADSQAIIELDSARQSDRSFVNYIHKVIAARGCFAAIVENRIVGYGFLEYKFFDYGFFSMVHVHPNFSCHGVAKAIIQHLEQACKTSKIFTSTNEQSKHMQDLLKALDYQPSGTIENLNSESPEFVFFKQLRVQE